MRHINFIVSVRTIVSLFLIVTASCGSKFESQGYSMGTTYTLKAQNCPSPGVFDRARRAFYEIDASMSNWSPESETTRLNSLPPGGSMRVSLHMESVLAMSVRISRESEGLFDPGIGALIELWGFGVRQVDREPDQKDIREALAQSGIAHIRLENGIVSRARPVQFNPGGIAKGYAVDLAFSELKGCESAMVEAGGELRVRGTHRISVQHPSRQSGVLAQFDLRDEAAATSGVYANRIERNGKRYAHIIHPKTGLPSYGPVSATVVGPQCAEADALATALILADEQQAARIMQRFPGYRALSFYETAAGYRPVLYGDFAGFECANPAASATDRATAAARGTTTLLPNCL